MAGRPVVDSVVVRLRRVAEECRQAGRTRLPPSRVLARQAGVSLPTLLRALGRLREEGLVTASPGRGTHLAGPRADQPSTAAASRLLSVKWQRVSQALAADILSAMDSPGHGLPSTKQLCARYGASRMTIRKALRQLLADGVLRETPHGLQPRMPAAPGRDTVVLFALGAGERELAQASGRTAEHLRGLESACSRAGVTLAIVPCPEALQGMDPGRAWRRASQAAGNGTLLGALVWAVAMRCDWRRFLARRPSPALPVALLDEVGDEGLAGAVTGAPLARLFTMANSRLAGEDVGRWLIARGHRRVAFFSADHQAAFSRNRLAGLTQAFEAHGLSGSVHPHTEPDLYRAPATRELTDECTRLVQAAAGRVAGRAAPNVSPRRAVADALAASGYRIAVSQVEQWAIGRRFAEAFRACCVDPAITAWVAVTDRTALACLRFLQAQDRAVTLVGFDNSELASTHGITSYDFNSTAVMQAMVSFVLEPRWKALRPSGETSAVELSGFVVERGMAFRR